MKEYFGIGWHDLIDSAFDLIDNFPDAMICSAKRCMGMLHMYGRADDEMVMNAVEGVLWKIERLSSNLCEHCGSRGIRRKELKKLYCLCNDCYLTHLNSTEDPMSLFIKGREGRFNEE
jgi:hypothetical protein